jgi:hypothetical protein
MTQHEWFQVFQTVCSLAVGTMALMFAQRTQNPVARTIAMVSMAWWILAASLFLGQP